MSQAEAREFNKSIAPTGDPKAQRGCIISPNKGKGKIGDKRFEFEDPVLFRLIKTGLNI